MNTAALRIEARTSHEVEACPACGATSAADVGDEAAGFRSVVGGRTFEHPAYRIRECGTCGLYFKSRTLSAEELSDYYVRLGGDSFDSEENFPTDAAIRELLASLPDGAKVLDFGCSSGRVHRASASRLQTYGVEVNPEAAGSARRKGLRIVSEEEATGAGPFDMIIAADVYEHLLRPVETMAKLAAALAPAGRLVLVTGNADAVTTRDWIGEFWYFRPEGHLQMASEKHVAWLVDRLSLRLEQSRPCCHYDLPFSTRIFQHAQAFAYGRFRRSPRSALASLLRVLPLMKRAEHWPLAPALTCTDDHLVIVLRKP